MFTIIFENIHICYSYFDNILMTHENTNNVESVTVDKYLHPNETGKVPGEFIKKRLSNQTSYVSSKDEFRMLQVYNDLCEQLHKDPKNKRLKSDILILENYIALL
jgi:hypothetical protein